MVPISLAQLVAKDVQAEEDEVDIDPISLKVLAPEPSDTPPSLASSDNFKSLIANLTAAYASPYLPAASRLAPATKLAEALLSYFYPAAQGFHLRETDFSMMTHGGCGWTVECKLNGLGPETHLIHGDCIGGYLVDMEYEISDGEGTGESLTTAGTESGRRDIHVLHTAMAVFSDDLATQDQWAVHSSVKLADIMSWDLGVLARIKTTVVFVLIGTELQVWSWNGKTSEQQMMRPWKHPNNQLTKIGNKFKLSVEGNHWEHDLKLVERMVKDAAMGGVEYFDGTVGEGPFYDD